MGRIKFVDVPMPAKAFRLDSKKAKQKHFGEFESEDSAYLEDKRRAKLLKQGRFHSTGKLAKKLKRLEKRLLSDEAPKSLASSRYMRGVRLRICGHLWKMFETKQPKSLRFFTLIPRNWEIAAGHLQDFCPVRALRNFRRILNLYGANTAKGFFYAAIHGSFDPISKKYQLHLHGLASGKMVEVLERLRQTKNLISTKRDLETENVRQRVSVSRKRIDNLPRTVSYTLKAFWPSRIGKAQADDQSIPAGKRRIPNPYHAEYLLWLDRLETHNLILTIGLSASRHGYRISKRRVQ